MRGVSAVMEEGSQTRKRVMIGISVTIFLVAAAITWYIVGGKTPAAIAANRGFICSECQESFDHKISIGETEPVECPKCGKRSGYEAEACYWTKGPGGEWKAKLQPTYVLLKSKVNPGSREKTICPDCGHVVVGHNPMPPDGLMVEAMNEAKK